MITVKRVISQVDYNYKILCAGKDFDIGKGMDVAFQYGSSIYNVTMHNSTAGRIGKLTKWYKENNIQEGMEISLCYDPNQKCIIASLSEEFSNQNTYEDDFNEEFDDDWDFDDDIDDTAIKEAKCNKCGTVLPVDAAFCYKCGERVTKDDVGEQFDDDYTDTEKYNSNSLDFEEEQRREMLEDIFQDLDQLVWHGEHYIRKHRPTNMSVNNKWIIYRDNRDGNALYIMNSQDSYYKIKIDTPVQGNLLGMNGKGIWTADYSYVVSDRFGGAWLQKIYCYDVLNHTRKTYLINKSKGRIYNSDICIYNDEIYYIVELSEDKCAIMRLNESGEEELFVAHEDEQLYDLSVDETRIAFRYNPSNRQYGIENAYAVIIDKGTGASTVIGLTDDPAEARRPLIPIHLVDIRNNMMATELTPYEMSAYQVNASDDYMIWAVRPLAEPAEFKLCTFASDYKPAIYPILKNGTYFFDFHDCYAAPNEYQMNRIDISGRIFTIGPFGHGEADKIVISRDYVFCNCDAYNMGRYPRKFNSSRSCTEENPEVDLIFGTNDFRFS